MIFTSDLDRTLIYSTSFLDSEIETKPIEYKEDIPLSYISLKAIELLTSINNQTLFIPVTTRSIEQYNRLEVFSRIINPKYAITTNGAVILENGKEDLVWKKIIQDKLSNLLPPSKLIELCRFFLEQKEIKAYRCCDEIFIYAVLKDREKTEATYQKLQYVCSQNGYRTFQSGRKIYIIPAAINKFTPIKYIMEKEHISKIISSGDSILDLPMLIEADYSFIPQHAELCNNRNKNLNSHENIKILNSSGHRATEELLIEVTRLLSLSAS